MENDRVSVTFRISVMEVFEYSVRNLLQSVRGQKSGGRVCLAFGVLAVIVSMAQARIPIALPLTAAILFMPLFHTVKYIRAGVREKQTVTAGGGLIQVRGRKCTTFLSTEIHGVINGWSILLLERQVQEHSKIYYIIPKQAFSSRAERERFINCLGESGGEAGLESPEDRFGEHEWEGELVFDLDQEQIVCGMAELNQLVLEQKACSTYAFKAIMVRIALFYVPYLLVAWLLPPAASLFRLIALGWLIHIFIRKTPMGQEYYQRFLEQRKAGCNLVGHWTMRMNAEGIYVFQPHENSFMRWDFYQELIERQRAFYLFRPGKIAYEIIPRSAFEEPEDIEAFFQYLRGKGLRIIPLEKRTEQGKNRSAGTAQIWQVGKRIELGAAVLLLVLGMVPPIGRTSGNRSYDNRQQSRWRAGVSFDEQIEILESLGIQIPEQDQEDYRFWMEEEAEYQYQIEHNPYVDILSYAGYGSYDEETGEWIYLDRVFWFYTESADISRGYINIMDGIGALGKGEFTLTNVSESGSRIDWESGIGALTVSFYYNGTPYRFTAEIDHDQIDGEVIEYFNGVLEKEGSLKRLYQLDDGEQGVILFYNTGEWAEEFREKTGLRLELNQTEV